MEPSVTAPQAIRNCLRPKSTDDHPRQVSQVLFDLRNTLEKTIAKWQQSKVGTEEFQKLRAQWDFEWMMVETTASRLDCLFQAMRPQWELKDV